jgi:hypothetical protein
LDKHSFIDHKKGYNSHRPDDRRYSSKSRIGLLPKLSSFMKKHGLTHASTRVYANFPVIRRKAGEDALAVQALGTPKTLRDSERFIRRYNAFLTEQEIDLAKQGGAVFLDEVEIYRVFNRGKWWMGGRFYGGWWMNCPKELRRFIRINDEPTIELDYRAQHINLLYALRGIALPTRDPYTISGLDRDFVKNVCLKLINAASVEQAWQACRKGALYDKEPELVACLDSHLDTLDSFQEWVVDPILARHPSIAKDFCQDKGIELMRIDSDICQHVLTLMTNQEIPCLSVHDSFLVPEEHEKTLRYAMAAAYELANLGAYIPDVK